MAAVQSVEDYTAEKSEGLGLTWEDLYNIEKFESADECRKYNSAATICSDYILGHPCDADDVKWWISSKFLIAWASASDEIMVVVGGPDAECVIKSAPLLSVFFAACSKYSLEVAKAEEKRVYSKEMHVYALTKVVGYYINNKKAVLKTNDKESKVPKSMSKYVKMYNQGELKAFLEKSFDSYQSSEDAIKGKIKE